MGKPPFTPLPHRVLLLNYAAHSANMCCCSCYYHGCPACFPPDTFNQMVKKPMAQLQEETRSRKRKIEALGYKVDDISECEWNICQAVLLGAPYVTD